MEILLLFFTGHRLFLMTPQTQGSASSGDTLHCSFWSLNPQGFIFIYFFTHDENRMYSIDLRRGVSWGNALWGFCVCGSACLLMMLATTVCLLLFHSNCFAQSQSQSFLREDIVKFKTIEVSDLIIILITNRPESADLIQITDWSV